MTTEIPEENRGNRSLAKVLLGYIGLAVGLSLLLAAAIGTCLPDPPEPRGPAPAAAP